MKGKVGMDKLICRDLSKRFGHQVALNNISFSVGEGEFFALLGPSGSGKTTLLRLLAGFERPDTGCVALGAKIIVDEGYCMPPEQRHIGVVFQDFALFPHLTVQQNIGFGVKGQTDANDRIREVTELVGLTHKLDGMPHELSGGEQQRVALARALAPRPEVILMDEPFSNLDAELRRQVRGRLRSILRTAGVTTLFVTHDQEEALSLADRVGVLYEGALLQIGTPEDLYHRPLSRRVASFIGDANIFRAEVKDHHAVCELGTFPLSPTASGLVTMLLRPEDLCLSEQGAPGKIAGVDYFGHDILMWVQLASGTLLRLRLLGSEQLHARGEQVKIKVKAGRLPHLLMD